MTVTDLLVWGAAVVAAAKWGRPLYQRLVEFYQALAGLAPAIQHTEERIVATIQDMKDALAEQNAAILAEMEQVNAALDELRQDPARMDEIVAGIRANTEAVKGIIADPLPEPTP